MSQYNLLKTKEKECKLDKRNRKHVEIYIFNFNFNLFYYCGQLKKIKNNKKKGT